MASGCVLKYAGKRGVTWSIKYLDADGRQTRELLGKAADGWTKRKADAALRARLTDVDRTGYRKPEPVTFETFALQWLDTYPEAEGLRRTTRHDYRAMVVKHFIPVLGQKKLATITTADLDAYIAAKRKKGLAARTLNVHITRIGQILDAARREKLILENPARDAKRPKTPKSRWTILSPVEVQRVLRAFDELIAEAETVTERKWLETAKAMTLCMLYGWLRRGELLGLVWGVVELSHPDGPRLHVRETWVRGYKSLPKTDDGTRTISLAAPLAEALWEHWRRSSFQGDGELVFGHPDRGTPVPSGYFGPLVKRALARAAVARPMREFHDWRHTGITNAAASGMEAIAIMQMAGHADFKTTEKYIDLAGVVFGDEVAKLGKRYGAASVAETA